MRAGIAVVMVMLAWTTARAEDQVTVKAGDYTIIAAARERVDVRKGKRRAPLEAKFGLVEGKVDTKAKTVVLKLESECIHEVSRTYTFDQLEARLANASGLVLHRAKKHARAAVDFAVAAKLDPAWELPAYNLASAHNLLGDQKAAVAALAPWIASAPVVTYAAVAADPQLVSLLDAPEFTALKAKTPGTAKTLGTHRVEYAYAPERNLIAYDLGSHGYLSCAGADDIRIHDIATGRQIATISLATLADYNGVRCPEIGRDMWATHQKKLDARLAKREAIADRILADLGFSQVESEDAFLERNVDKPKASLPKAKLGVVIGQHGTTNVLRGNTTVGSYPGSSTKVTYLDAAKAMVYRYEMQNEDGCPTTLAGAGPIK